MHELSLTEALIDLVEAESRRQGFARVRAVHVEIGALSSVGPDAMRFCFDAVTRGTIAEGATLDVVTTPASGWCPDCVRTVPVLERFGPCVDCGGFRVQAAGGDDLRLKELEVE